MVSWDKVAEELVEYVWGETGIMLDEKDFSFEVVGSEVAVSLDNQSLCRVEYDEGSEEVDIVSAVLGQLGDSDELRKRLVEVKISQLETRLPEVVRAVRKSLRVKSVSEKVIDSLEFEIHDFGYFPAMHGMTEAEVVNGYPDIELLITTLDGLEFTWPLNIYTPQKPVEVDDLVQELLKELKP
jgi:hypothetical protein